MKMSLTELRRFEAALNTFESDVTNNCNRMLQGISNCRSYMQKDENAKKALDRGEQLVTDIKACLNPTQLLLEKIREMIKQYESEDELSFGR